MKLKIDENSLVDCNIGSIFIQSLDGTSVGPLCKGSRVHRSTNSGKWEVLFSKEKKGRKYPEISNMFGQLSRQYRFVKTFFNYSLGKRF